MTPPVVIAELPQPHDTVTVTSKHPTTVVTSIDVTEQALAELEINDKPNNNIEDNTNDETNGKSNNKSSDEIDDKPTNKYHNKYHGGANTLLRPRAITTDFDLLRFHAAAYTQLSHSTPSARLPPCFSTHHDPQTQTTAVRPLISSPYNKTGHYLDLADDGLSRQSQLFAMALTALKPTGENYATAPYTEALNFDVVLDVLRTLISHEVKKNAEEKQYEWKETSFYVVVFRSQLKPDIDQEYLYQLDEESHREACESGGLLKYWFGKADGERRNLATCKSSPLIFP
jgi:hypothetical protein